MIPRLGKLIVFDGNDGSGKATQAELLLEELKDHGHEVTIIDFPRYYDNVLGKFIGECLRGDHGNFAQLDPKITSVLFAADRYESRDQVLRWLNEGIIVICDRYVSANMIHQGGKIDDQYERESFITWLEHLEHEVFQLPRPDLIVYLDVPVHVSQKNLKEKRDMYANGKPDQHENDRIFLKNSHETARWLAGRSDIWELVSCAPRGAMRTREDIHNEVYSIVNRLILGVDAEEEML